MPKFRLTLRREIKTFEVATVEVDIEGGSVSMAKAAVENLIEEDEVIFDWTSEEAIDISDPVITSCEVTNATPDDEIIVEGL